MKNRLITLDSRCCVAVFFAGSDDFCNDKSSEWRAVDANMADVNCITKHERTVNTNIDVKCTVCAEFDKCNVDNSNGDKHNDNSEFVMDNVQHIASVQSVQSE
jgi:hypothetical protein